MQLASLFTGQLVRLAAPRPDDHQTLAHFSENDQFLRIADDDPARPHSAESYAAWETPFLNAPDVYAFRIRTLTDDALIGTVVLGGIKWSYQAGTLGIVIGDPAYWGKGYGSDAVRLMLRYAFHELNLHRVGLTTIAYNTRAVRAFEKVGFVPEGVSREMIHRDGQRFDVLHFGMLRHEWEARQA
ncbi:MAG: GNAT family N-acetyltransferase [Chloroflexota bacterium]